jgi:hypothetical protein
MRKVILLVLFLVASFTAMFIYQDQISKFVIKMADKGEAKVEEVVINAIAFLNDMKGNVAYKRSKETIWNIGEKNLGFEVFDTVSTGPNAIAELGFKLGPVFNLDENSLIVIQEPLEDIPNLTEVDFNQGSFKASNNLSDNAILRVKTDNMLVETVGVFDYNMEVDKKARKAKIYVSVGSVKLTDGLGNEDWVMVNQTKEISTEDISKSLVAEKIKEEPIPVIEPPVVEKPVVKKPVKKRRPRRKPAKREVKKEEPKKVITQEKIWKSITKDRIRIEKCVQGVAIEKGSILNLMVQVQPSGKVSDIEITKSTLRDKSVESCIMSSIENTRFDKFDSENKQPINEAVYFVFDQDMNNN